MQTTDIQSTDTTPIPLFEERQRITQWWVYALVILPMLPILVILILAGEIDTPEQVGLFFIIFLGTAGLIPLIRMDTKIDQQAIRVRLFPFHLKYRIYPWNEIESAEVRKYSPLGEYGGWGIRYGGKAKGWAYNVKGDRGLQIVLNDGKRVLIGTSSPNSMERAIAARVRAS